MNTVLFVFAQEESRKKYQLFIDAVEDYGYSVKIVSSNYYNEEMKRNVDEYLAVVSDFNSEDAKIWNITGLQIDQLINDINVICVK